MTRMTRPGFNAVLNASQKDLSVPEKFRNVNILMDCPLRSTHINDSDFMLGVQADIIVILQNQVHFYSVHTLLSAINDMNIVPCTIYCMSRNFGIELESAIFPMLPKIINKLKFY